MALALEKDNGLAWFALHMLGPMTKVSQPT